MKTRKLMAVVCAMAMSFVAGTALAQTTITGTTGGNNSWNTALNWSAGVPSGAINAVVAVDANVDNTSTPTYSGNLTLNAGRTLQIMGGNPGSYNVLGTPASTTISLNAGVYINFRAGGAPSIPAIQLLGNAKLSMGQSTVGDSTPNFGKAITGAYTFTLQGKGNCAANLNADNDFGLLLADCQWGSGWRINAKVAGSLGGDVLIPANTTGGRTAILTIDAANAMDDDATLSIYGNDASLLTVNYNDTIGRLVINGVAQPLGTYGKVGSSATYPSSWYTGNGILTVAGTATPAYWDSDGDTAGAGGATPTGTWGSDNYWSTATAGDVATGAWTPGQTAVFAAGMDATDPYQVTVSGTQDIKGFSFEEGAVTVSGDGLRMTGDSDLSVAAGLTGTVSSAISDDGTAWKLTKAGSGTLTLGGASSYTGITTLSGGMLSVGSLANAGNSSPIGAYATSGAGGLTLSSGTFQYTGGTATTDRGLTVSGNSTIDVNTAGTTLTIGACKSTLALSTLTVTGGAGSSLRTGIITTMILAVPTLNPTTASMVVAGIDGYSQYGYGDTVITLGGSSTGNEVTGVIRSTADGAYPPNLALVKSGTSDWTLKGASTYGLNTYVYAGNLIAGANAPSNVNGPFGKATSDIGLGVANGNNNAGILIGGAFTIGRTIRNATQNTTDTGSRVLTLGGTTAHNSIFSGAIYLGTASQATKGVTLTAANGGTVTFSAAIQDPTGQDSTEAANARALTAVTKVGLGTVALTAANAYVGGTTVSEGTLKLGNGNANSSLNNYSDLSVASGALLNLNFISGNVDTVLRLFLGGSPMSVGQYGHTASGADNGGAGVGVYDAYFSGTGIINNLGGILVNEYLWDGGTIDIVGDGNAFSGGGNGTWDTTIQNWDRGITAHAAWGNTGSDSAVFGAGTANYIATITTPITLGSLTFEDSAFSHTISGGTLNFGAGGTIVNKNDTSSKIQKITSAITGSPSVALAAGSPAGGAEQYLEFAPTSGTVTLGTVNLAYNDGDGGDKSHLRLAGSTTSNTIASVTQSFVYGGIRQVSGGWTLGNVTAGRIWLDGGTMIINGTFSSTYVGLATFASGVRLGGNLTYSMGASNYGQFIVGSGSIVAPGNPAVANGVGTVTVEYVTGNATVGQTTFNTGSIYEWQIGPANVTDKVHVKRTVTATNNNRTLTVGAMVLKIKDAGGTPKATDKLTVFTYDANVVRTLSLASVVCDTSALVGGWTGTPSLVDDNNGTIYLTGLQAPQAGTLIQFM